MEVKKIGVGASIEAPEKPKARPAPKQASREPAAKISLRAPSGGSPAPAYNSSGVSLPGMVEVGNPSTPGGDTGGGVDDA
jgi:hypothetical protein